MVNQLKIGKKTFEVNPLFAAEEQTLGLMHQVKPNLTAFIFKESKPRTFWMQETPCPLDLIFCQQGVVSDIRTGEPFSEEHLTATADLVLEAPSGWAEAHIALGSSVDLTLDLPTLRRKLQG